MYRIGVDLGGTNIATGVIDSENKIIGLGKLKTNSPRPAREIFDDIIKTVYMAIEDAGITIEEVESIGMGTPGSVDKKRGMVLYSNNIRFKDVEAVKMLKEEFANIEVRIENDANCAALAEAIVGCGKGKSSLIAVTLGTGVGGGIVLDQKLVTGFNDIGAELGHTSINFEGTMCNCGRRGCWEAYASASALIAQTKEAMLENKDSKMWELCGGDIEKTNGRTSFDAMRLGDEAGKKVVDTYIGYIAVGCVNIINTFQPEVICLGGGICNEGETLLAPLRELAHASSYGNEASVPKTEFHRAILGNDAGIIGAALINY
ncbi:MAG: ROK family protein [Clostridia bacterium]